MKTFIAIFAFLAVASAKRFFHGDQVLRIQPSNLLELKLLDNLPEQFPEISFWTDARGSRPVDIHVPKRLLDRVKVFLTYSRVSYDVFIEDLQVAIDNQVSDRPLQMSLATFDYNVYHTLDEIYQWIDDMVSTYSIVTKTTYGKSYEGRDIKAIKISTGGFNKPAFVIDCGLHAREWVAPASCMYAAKYFVEAKAGSEEYNLLQNIDVYITLIGNPDGYQYTWTGDRMWRKTRSDNGARCLGVDPNRNWDVSWSGPGASASSCNDAYYGPSAMSEVEVSSKAAFVGSIPNAVAYIDVHAYSQYWMYPYAYTYSKCSDDAVLGMIGQESAQAIYNVHQKVYQSGPISQVIYQASGSTTDYMYEKLGIKCSYAAELRDTGLYGFTLPERFIQPTAEETFAGLKVIATYAGNGQCG